MIYISIYLYCIVMTILAITKQFQKHNKLISALIIIILVLIAGLRFEVGYDYDSYYRIYNEIPTIKDIIRNINIVDSIDIEKGYLTLNSIVKSIGGNFNLLLIIMTIITLSILIISINRYSCYPMLSLLIYVSRFFFIRDMGQIRSSIACVIVLYSIKFIINKDLKNFIISIMIATSFHKVAIFGLLLYIINLKEYKNGNYIYTVLILSLVLNKLGIADGFINCIVGVIPEYSDYMTSAYYTNSSNILNPVTIMQVTILLFMAHYYNVLNEKDKYYKVLINGYLISTSVLIFFSNYYTLAGRLSTLFATFEILIIPMIVKYLFGKKVRLKVYILAIIYCIVIFYLVFLKKSINAYIPYKSILFL